MSVEIARYQFHAWARKGIAANIVEGDDLGSGTASVKEHAEIPISVTLNATAVTKNFSLIGPGDIIGIDSAMIVRTEPLNWITDFEPNYLAFIEFYDEDFIWRYTPASAAGTKLRPWLFLLILKENEFERTKRKLPLPSININNKGAFPPLQETWLWGHVHSNANIPDSELSDYEKFLLSLNKIMNDDPDQLFCRLMSPRRLEPNTQYHAFLIPAFETGRLAGIDLPTATTIAQQASWDVNGAKGEMPVYFEWFFQTGNNADFESLVKLLEPRPMDPKVGIRDMDASRPGFVEADDNTKEIPGTLPPILGLEGALKSPTTQSTVFPDPPESEFQKELQKIVNLPAIQAANLTEDPIVSVPLYGGKHAKKSSNDAVLLDISKDTWVNDLNKDPRTRVPAGFGTLVIQNNQETYMQKAWAQVAKIIEANRKIKATRFAMQMSAQYTQKTFSSLQSNVLMAISKPVHSRVMGSPTTIHQQIEESILPSVVFSGAFRRLIRPNGRLVKKLQGDSPLFYHDLVNQINDSIVTASPPKIVPAGLPDTKELSEQIFPNNLSDFFNWLMKNYQFIFIALIILLVLLALITLDFLIFGPVIVVVVAAFQIASNYFTKIQADKTAADALSDPKKEEELVKNIPPQPDFTISLSDEITTPAPTTTTPSTDSVEAENFRVALTDFTKRMSLQQPDPVFLPLDLTNAYNKISTAIHPYKSFPFRLATLIQFPGYIELFIPEKIFPAMAYPDFEEPMYKKLCDISNELLIPNLKLIPQNTISLLKTNQKFIESYLVGLNHEMGRELLWREYPTDERPSSFRQFWDVKGIIRPVEGKSEAELTEAHKDIKPIHTWLVSSLLGRHNNRDAEGDAEQVVLIIRGDLLKRYPNTVIFAQKAIAGEHPNDEPVIDLDLSETEFKTQVRFPLYKADIAPDIKFFGFDLTISEARGTDPTKGFNDNLGWFFIIQEVPGEPRFGMDINFNQGSDGLSWDDLAWTNFNADMKFITAVAKPNMHPSDAYRWGTDSANMAFILFQKPSMVAVHAKEMLESLTA
ncbi:conserved hypothetical protein [Crenothrix polyspora]|uniref:Uncharacterized protein n=1 Tax=Crenothrix polyspora TaxID=360316 RepID=A0A1R4HHM4_9GAMM|nr:hypothetical protein [Crenothrix polyspora]SJM95717.1 conserved hypothetical protein [Crenothrix polyspora]